MSSLPLNKHTLLVQFTSLYIFARAADHHHLPIFFNTLSSNTPMCS